MKIVTMIILVLYLDGNPIEFMGHHETSNGWERMGMSGCLKMKRTLKRNGWKDNTSGTTRYVCEKRSVKVGPNYENKEIVKGLE